MRIGDFFMKIFKKLLALCALPLLLLSSCGKYSQPYGTYEFIMGDIKQGAAGARLELTNDAYPNDKHPELGYKMFKLLLFFGKDDTYPTSSNPITLSGLFEAGDDKKLNIEGTYYIKDTRLMLNCYFMGTTEISAEYVSIACLSYYYGKNISVIIPVSENDLAKRAAYIAEGHKDDEFPPMDDPNHYWTLTIDLSR